MNNPPLLSETAAGLRCESAGVVVDPALPVEKAVVTHAHADHARPGCGAYLCPEPALPLLRRRLGPEARLEGLAYGERRDLGSGVTLSFHPSGHILGAAQARLERAGEVWVVTGDYKREPDPTCPPFEPVRCDVLVTEATYALPVYRWGDPSLVAQEILAWWDACRAEGRPAALFCWPLGKAQRILGELGRLTDRPVLLHGAMQGLTELYRDAGVRLAAFEPVGERKGKELQGALVLAPPAAGGSPWMKRLPGASTAFASGEMRIRGNRRRASYDRGFALSDHADWRGLLRTVRESGATRVLCAHGHHETLARWLRDVEGLDAQAISVGLGAEEEVQV